MVQKPDTIGAVVTLRKKSFRFFFSKKTLKTGLVQACNLHPVSPIERVKGKYTSSKPVWSSFLSTELVWE